MIEFTNDSTRIWLARRGPSKVFGIDVDRREHLTDEEAINWFDQVWSERLQELVSTASECDLDFVRDKVPPMSQGYIDEAARHREFKFATCLFICQLPEPTSCNQLWFIPSSSSDPRLLYVKFESVPIKQAFDAAAAEFGWKPEQLAEKVLLDFLTSVRRLPE